MHFSFRSTIRLGLRSSSGLLALTLAVAGMAATPPPASAKAATAVAPEIVRARELFATASKGRPDIGDNPLAKDYGAHDTPFAETLVPVLEELDRVVEKHPASAAARVERARVRLVYQAYSPADSLKEFKLRDAISDLERATELEPANAAAWFELGLAHLAVWHAKEIFSNERRFIPIESATAGPKKVALTAAVHAFSRAIYAKPEASGLAHFARTWAQRALGLGADAEQTFVDADAAITQNFRPTDAAWDAVLHPARSPTNWAANLADAFYLRAKVRLSRGESTDALSDLDSSLTMGSTNLSARFDRGKLLIRRGAYAAAITDLSTIIIARPKAAEVWFWRGIAHDGAGEIELASADLGEATQHDASIRAKLANTRYDLISPNPARGIAPRPVTTDHRPLPPGSALHHKNAGNALRGKGDIYGALREYTFATLIDPTFADAFSNRGSVYMEFAEPDLAMVEFDHTITLDPRHRAAYLNRGLLWRELGDHAREREDLDHAVEYADIDDRRADALLNRGRTFENAREIAPAEADYLRATQLAPTKSAAWQSLAYFEANQKRDQEAVTHFRKALELKPDHFGNRVMLAVVLANLDDPASATELDTALASFTNYAQLDEAAKVVEEALKANPQSARLKTLQEKIKTKKAKRVFFV
ncbi:MAG: tetratricopeptide repeat protein [Lacunisphaera sp.]